MCGFVLKSGVGSEEQNNHSNFYEIFSKTTLPSDDENWASPFATYQTVRFILANLGGTWWSPLHSEYVPLAEEQDYPTLQFQQLQRWSRQHLSLLGLWRQQRLWSLWSVWSLCKTGNWEELQSWGEDLSHSVQWEDFIQSALLAEQRSLFRGLTCASVSRILYEEPLLWNSKPLCVSEHAHFQAKVRAMVPRLLGQDPFGEWWC